MKQPLDDTLIVVAELMVKPDKLDAFFDYAVEILKLGRGYGGNIQFDILFNAAQPERVIFYEAWESPQAQEDFVASRIQAGDRTKLRSLLAAEPQFTPWRRLAA